MKITLLVLLLCTYAYSFSQETETNNYTPDSVVINLDSIRNDTFLEEFNPQSSDFYQKFDTLYIRRQKQDMRFFSDTLLMVLNQNFYPPFLGPVISNYGPRGKRIHTGIDIRLNLGDTVRAAFDGVVRISRVYSGYGKLVVLRHENGLETAYAHFSKLLVHPYDTVKAGQAIGLGGRTGRATCNHLHFETRLFGEPMNPNIFIDFVAQKLKEDSVFVTASTFSTGKKTPVPRNINNSQPVLMAGTSAHQIKPGDTLYALSRKYGTSVKQICELNDINEKTVLRIGQLIKIPSSSR
ncbi:MAG: hypothetical protein CVU05_13095 [Bacteroidetes bacterium HGW-Bacteroidetes-21]|jgi:murein DD-endopeptidase MepM/ murein hydrolase activator NlpD|nr:MAG: hypothetical protein CVU05_13095 [Bacteroidetes bacterium HGW-Bacteroidetes-21]